MNPENSIIKESGDISRGISDILNKKPHKGLFLLTDTNVDRCVLPLLIDFMREENPEIIVIDAGEENKNLDSLASVWQRLSDGGATRDSLLINLGGGVVTDLGGFAAATFKRGIQFINVPTTILGAVDAAVGGKTGIDFLGLKNEIGAFSNPEAVLISAQPLATLPHSEIISGFGEIVKTAIISSRKLYRNLLADPPLPRRNLNAEADSAVMERLGAVMAECVRFKEKITLLDPKERGLRKILNFGHTGGHAFETLLLRKGKPAAHGVAVAHGVLLSLVLSHMLLGLPSEEIELYRREILPLFPTLPLTCRDCDAIIELAGHDKKNLCPSTPLFILLRSLPAEKFLSSLSANDSLSANNSLLPSPFEAVPVSNRDLRAALDIYLDLTGH